MMKKVGSMSKKKKDEDEDEEDDKPKYKSTKKEDFIFKDLKTAYIYWLNYLPENTHQEYVAKRKCVRIGCALLKTNDIGSKLEIIEEAKKTLKDAIPKRRETGFVSQDIAGTKWPVYKMTATDAGESHAREDEMYDAKRDFRDQQYENCIEKLEDIDVRILGILTDNDVIPTLEPPLDELMVKMMRIRFNEKLNEYTRRIKKDATST